MAGHLTANWNPMNNPFLPLLMMQMQAMQPRPMQQPAQPPRPSSAPMFQPGYGALLGAGALNAQNNAMANAVAQGNNAIVSGGLRSVSSPSGTSIQNPGLFTAQMNAQPHANARLRFDAANQGDYHIFGTPAGLAPPATPAASPAASGGATAPAASDRAGTSPAATGASPAGTGANPNALNPFGDLVTNLMNDYQSKMDAANAANIARYDEGKAEIQRQNAANNATVNAFGRQQAQDINRAAFNAQGAATQNAVARGLANTSVPAANQRAIERERVANQARLGDTLARQRMDSENLGSSRLTDWIFNRSDNAPSMQDMANLLAMLGESGYGSPKQDLGDLGLGNLFGGLGDLLRGLQQPQMNPGMFAPFQGGGMFSVPSAPAQKPEGGAAPAAGGGGGAAAGGWPAVQWQWAGPAPNFEDQLALWQMNNNWFPGGTASTADSGGWNDDGTPRNPAAMNSVYGGPTTQSQDASAFELMLMNAAPWLLPGGFSLGDLMFLNR